MADGQDDLAWDYTGESLESDPLLDGYTTGNSVFYSINNENAGYQLSKRQVEYLIHSLDDAAGLLKTYLADIQRQQNVPGSGNQRNPSRICGCCQCLFSRIRIPSKVMNNLFVITVILQALTIVFVTIFDAAPHWKDEQTAFIITAIVMITLQCANLILVIFSSIKLTNQFFQRSINNWFLAQSYLATVLLFAGIYTTTYRMDKESWHAVAVNQTDIIEDPILVVSLYSKMLFVSVSTGTLCGNCNITPRMWYNYMFLAIQMLLSFLYFASIVTQTIGSNPLRSHPPLQRRRQDSNTSVGTYTGDRRVTYGTLSGTQEFSPRRLSSRPPTRQADE